MLTPTTGAVERGWGTTELGASPGEAGRRAPTGGISAMIGASACMGVVMMGGGRRRNGVIISCTFGGITEDGVSFADFDEAFGCRGIVWVVVWVVGFGEGIEGFLYLTR